MDVNPFHKFSENTKFFLKHLEETLNHKLYFFGSSVRLDYIQDCDIDVAIFTDNIPSLITKINGLLNTENNFKKTAHVTNNQLVTGYKLIYVNNDINIELVIYDNKFKNIMLNFYESSFNMPIIISIILLILKYIKKFNILTKKMYFKIKKFLINNFMDSNKMVVFD